MSASWGTAASEGRQEEVLSENKVLTCVREQRVGWERRYGGRVNKISTNNKKRKVCIKAAQ